MKNDDHDWHCFAAPEFRPAGFFLRLWMRMMGKKKYSNSSVYYCWQNRIYFPEPGSWP